MTQAEFPLLLPPVDVVRELGDMLEPGVPRSILDAGCGSGRNSLYLGSLGHTVFGITLEEEELRLARHYARSQGLEAQCDFVQGDIRQLRPDHRSYDIVIMNEVTHLFTKTATGRLLDNLRALTKQGGLNVISGYVVRPQTANVRNTERCFSEGELRERYHGAGWRIVSYNEQYQPNQYIGSGAAQKEIIFSRAKLIAERPWLLG